MGALTQRAWAGDREPPSHSLPTLPDVPCGPQPCPPPTLLLASQSISQLVEGSHCQPKPGQRNRLAGLSSSQSCPPGHEETRGLVSQGGGDRCPEQGDGQGCAEGTSPVGTQAPYPSSAHIPRKQSFLPVPILIPMPCQRGSSPGGRTRRAPSWSRSVRLLASTLNFSAQASRSSFTPTTGAAGRWGEPWRRGDDGHPPSLAAGHPALCLPAGFSVLPPMLSSTAVLTRIPMVLFSRSSAR